MTALEQITHENSAESRIFLSKHLFHESVFFVATCILDVRQFKILIYELVLRNLDCSLEFVFSLLLLQAFNFSPVSFACNCQDWGCVILREIDFLLKICWSIPCLHPSCKVHTWVEICASLNHRKKTKADGSRLIPRKHTETLVLWSVLYIVSFKRPTCINWKATGVLLIDGLEAKAGQIWIMSYGQGVQ